MPRAGSDLGLTRQNSSDGVEASATSVGPGEAEGASTSGAQSDNQDDEETFSGLVASIAGEPLLGPLQVEAVRALMHRLAHGPAMTVEDRATARDMLAALRLPTRD